MSQALLVIDVQNDYFTGGSYPQWRSDAVLDQVERAITDAKRRHTSVVLIQHIADPDLGPAPFFAKGTAGAEIHSRVRRAAPDAPVVTKAFADSFEQTNLATTLTELGVNELLVCGMMTQNCVTHTAISKAAERYTVKVLPDCCSAPDEMIHMIALHALSTRVELVPSTELTT
ncbi:MAG: cysteine hydrolase [Myxococcales bacterium FL481]|nr:MAG: cysteine hydrolase [Myxococcales bacterium FL481]